MSPRVTLGGVFSLKKEKKGIIPFFSFFNANAPPCVTRGDLSQRHVPATKSHTCHVRQLVTTTSCRDSPQSFFLGSAAAGKACDWFIYRLHAVTCCKCMLHEGMECACDILSPCRVA